VQRCAGRGDQRTPNLFVGTSANHSRFNFWPASATYPQPLVKSVSATTQLQTAPHNEYNSRDWKILYR
jgi:hypothetical protein